MIIIRNRLTSLARFFLLIGLLTLVNACSDGGDANSEGHTSPAQTLLRQFANLSHSFSTKGLQALLNIPDQSSPVVLLQILDVNNEAALRQYELSAETVWQQHGGSKIFASRIIAPLIASQSFTHVRAIEFPNTPLLLDALHSAAFPSVANQLAGAVNNQIWLVGLRENIPLQISGDFFDPDLFGLDRPAALTLLQRVGADSDNGRNLTPETDAIVDMIVSDSPEPFFMVNLIKFREQAQYADGRPTDLSGQQANAIYGQAIGPQLLLRNSGPEILLPVSAVLTNGTQDWEQAVIVRYASRDAFLNIFPLNRTTDAAVIHKDAGVEETLVYVSERQSAIPVAGPLYNSRFCEILGIQVISLAYSVNVWGTQGLNNCPQDAWESLDRDAIALQTNAFYTQFDGPRFYVADWSLQNAAVPGTGEMMQFGDLQIQRRSGRSPDFGIDPGFAFYTDFYSPATNLWHYTAGRTVYELSDNDGNRYVMVSYSNTEDASLALDNLDGLGEKLTLPSGWAFSVRTLDKPLQITPDRSSARIIQDNLRNIYQYLP